MTQELIAEDRPAGQPAGRHRRRVVRALIVVLSTVLVLALVAVVGIGWYFSGQAIAVNHTSDYPLTVSGLEEHRVSLPAARETTLRGRYAMDWPGGHSEVGDVLSTEGGQVLRPFTAVQGRPAVGTKVNLNSFVYDGDPASALHLSFREVAVPGPLGTYPAWYVPAAQEGANPDAGRTWVIFVHGHDSSRQESLRYLTLLHALGLPVLVPTFRNDVGAPASPDGADHLGETEWTDVDAALTWAKGQGAKDFVLAGWSMGGAISLQVADRSAQRASIRGLLLDSPVTDWKDVFQVQGAARGLPGPMTSVAVAIVERRIGVDLGRFDWVARAGDLRLPVLLFASDDDTYVPDGPSKALAAKRPDLVSWVNIPGAEHTRSWNVDPRTFQLRTADWLVHLGVVDAQVAATAAA